eukprot:6192871-Pleurochrysis_carterae.AAC.2
MVSGRRRPDQSQATLWCALARHCGPAHPPVAARARSRRTGCTHTTSYVQVTRRRRHHMHSCMDGYDLVAGAFQPYRGA